MLLSTSKGLRLFRLHKAPVWRFQLSSDTTTDRNQFGPSTKQTFANEKLKLKAINESMKTRPQFLTVPNILTASRIVATPFIGYFICNGMNHYALACFTFAAATDLLDGQIARRYNLKSYLGAILDPIADKILLTTCFITLYHTSLVPLWLIRPFIVRDVLILLGGATLRYMSFSDKPSLKLFLDFENHPTLGLHPTLLSKINTALQCLLIPITLSCSHLIGNPVYDWSLFALQSTTFCTASFSIVQYSMRFLGHETISRPKL